MPDVTAAGPLLAASCYYGLVLGTAEISRRVLDRTVSKKSPFHRFLIEVFGTAQICTCVFENALIVQHYGVSSFFIVTSVLGFLFSSTGRGSYGTPLSPIEMLYYGEMRQVVTISAAPFRRSGWWSCCLEYRQSFVVPLAALFSSTYGNVCEKSKYVFHSSQVSLAFEVAGCFAMRLVLPKLPSNAAKFLAPAFVASLFSFAILFVGDAGLDPVVASSLFFGCGGLSAQWFILLYWVSPVVGWMIGAFVSRQPVRTPKKSKRSTKKKTD
ncbi:hypothetical protein Q1695_014971 [Nippostrongylus brasiliensis]|nr:hypothetical protein Q1695_014971 [Nippostrongylus brasiliensis]